MLAISNTPTTYNNTTSGDFLSSCTVSVIEQVELRRSGKCGVRADEFFLTLFS